MADDPYEVLGVPKDADEAAIKRAYKTLAKQLHPDLNPGDAEAEARFKAVSAAHDLLKDPEQRRRYDAGEIDATGQERPERRYYRDFADAGAGGAPFETGGFADFDDLSGVFSDLFGRGARARGAAGPRMAMRGRDALYALEVDFREAATGATKRLTLPTGETLDVRLPEGTADGQTIRLRGKGGRGYQGGPDGDALVTVAVRPDPVLSREGDDIVAEADVPFDVALLGGRVEVPTLTGTARVRVPEGSAAGDVLRLRGKGVRGGDQRVRLRIVMPEDVDDDLREAVRAWRERAGRAVA